MKIKQVSASQFALFIILFLAASFASSASARPRPPVIPFPEDHLGFWRFDFDDWWHSPYPFPVALENLATVESWSGSALQMRGPDRAILQYPILDDFGEPLLTCDTGSIRFWFAPDWTSGDPASNTADTLGRLIEAGLWTKDASAGWWSLYFNPDHTALYFSANAGGLHHGKREDGGERGALGDGG